MSNAPLASTVSGLSDRQLLEQIKKMIDLEQRLTLIIVDHLCEIEARSLHLKRGFSSLFDYAVTELGYTASAAWRRIQAMHLSSQVNGRRARAAGGRLADALGRRVVADRPRGAADGCSDARGGRHAFYDRPADSCIRGLHYTDPDEETRAEDQATAADLLNPEAVACFIRLVYDRFSEAFGEHFGTTIRGIFTDEPNEYGGKYRESGRIRPGNTGALAHVNRLLGYDFVPSLPALWFDGEPHTTRARRLQPRHAAAPA